MMRAILTLVALGLAAGAALAQEALTVAGHRVELRHDNLGMAALVVDDAVLIEEGVVFLDDAVLTIAGVSVVTGVAGPGGNACGAAPFVLALREGEVATLHGPVDSCREFALEVQPEALVFTTEPLPAEPGEVWVWTQSTGLTEADPVAFAGDKSLGWEALDTLALAHPADALRLAPVLAAVQAGLGPDYPVFAERISDLGSGDLTADGYLGQACLKYSCNADWAFLYLDRATQQVFVAWSVAGEEAAHVWPTDSAQWPEAAIGALPVAIGD